MSLQARLRHSLGERWIELPARGVEAPLVVGRSGNSDVQIPSVTVAQKHCVLFVHEGRWVVQDAGSGGAGTYVNGSKIAGPAFLHVGDVLTFGPDGGEAAIDIDPAGVSEGRTGQPAAAGPVQSDAAPEAAAPLYPSHGAVPGYPAAPAYAAPPPAVVYPPNYAAYPPGYGAPPAAPVPGQWAQHTAPAPAPAEAYAQDGGVVDWPANATPSYYTPRRRRPTGGGGGGAFVLGVMLTLLITAAAGFWLYRRLQAPAPVATQTPAPPPATRAAPPVTGGEVIPSDLPPSIFKTPDTQPQAATRSAKSAPPVAAKSPAPVPSLPPGTPPAMQGADGAMAGHTGDGAAGTEPSVGEAATGTDSAADASGLPTDDPAWKQIEVARHSKDEAKAILLFDEFARAHPGKAADKLHAYTEAMFDRLWFERIENLCDQRDELVRKITEAEKELAEETDAAHKKRVLVPLRQQYATRLEGIEEELRKNMNYEGKSAPNTLDEPELEKLRKSRDAQQYAAWKARILTHIRRTHGGLPWVADKSS